jgi:hypothetical protein
MNITPKLKRNALSLIRKTLRTLTTNRGFLRSSSTQTEESVRLNISEHYNSWKATEIALIEAERKKAEAIMHRLVLIK